MNNHKQKTERKLNRNVLEEDNFKYYLPLAVSMSSLGLSSLSSHLY